MKRFFEVAPIYSQRFENVHLWAEWAGSADGFDARDSGVDLVATLPSGGCCAIQCKCYSDRTSIKKQQVDSFLAVFTQRILVNTGSK